MNDSRIQTATNCVAAAVAAMNEAKVLVGDLINEGGHTQNEKVALSYAVTDLGYGIRKANEVGHTLRTLS